MPKEIQTRLHDETVKAMESPEVRHRIQKAGTEIAIASPAEFAAIIRADTIKYGKLVNDLGLKE